jgi:nitrogen regulatory protein P-II 1
MRIKIFNASTLYAFTHMLFKNYNYTFELNKEDIKVKLIIAIIQPHKLEEVKEELYKAEVNLITVNEVLGHGRQKGVTEVYRSARETGNLLRKIRLEIAVNDNFVENTIKAISKGAKTGETGDGKIFVLDLNECVRIRTEERGSDAIG